MPTALLNLDALRHNARQSIQCAKRWKVDVLPVLKGIRSHPLALREVASEGFWRFGFMEYEEAGAAFSEAPSICPEARNRVLIQICPPSRAKEVPILFGRSFQSSPETLSVVNQAAGDAGIKHDIMIMVDMGENREGVNMNDLPQLLEFTHTLHNLTVVGFSLTLGCQGRCMPDEKLHQDLVNVQRLFYDRGIPVTGISVGGSIFCRWLEE